MSQNSRNSRLKYGKVAWCDCGVRSEEPPTQVRYVMEAQQLALTGHCRWADVGDVGDVGAVGCGGHTGGDTGGSAGARPQMLLVRLLVLNGQPDKRANQRRTRGCKETRNIEDMQASRMPPSAASPWAQRGFIPRMGPAWSFASRGLRFSCHALGSAGFQPYHSSPSYNVTCLSL